jgi:pSer/pThr/pTyr-binding forkhead associated (FHA) protein
MASITLYLPEQEPLEVALDGYEQITVGRGPDNDLVLDHVSLSGSHAVLLNLGGVFQVQDLGSTNGTFVNGEAVSEAVLSHGSRVQFGAIEAIFQDEASAAEAGESFASGGGSGFGGGHQAELAEVSNRPSGYSDLSPIEKVVKKDPLALVATLVGVVALLAAIALAVLSATMKAA